MQASKCNKGRGKIIYPHELLFFLFPVENTRRSVGYVCVFRLDYQQNLSIFIYDIDYLKWYNGLNNH